MTFGELLDQPLVKGALAGAGAAAYVDYEAFKAWKSYKDIVSYDWPTAIFRWIKGAVVGAVMSLGYGWVR